MFCCNSNNNNNNNVTVIRGPMGPTGATGPRGLIGPQGPAGATGPQGPAGATGATGATGPQGPAGATGATGATGPQGPVGPQGPMGPQGPQGESGTNDVLYASNTGALVDSGAIIPLTLNAATSGTTMSVNANTVILPTTGYYLISYFANGSVPTGNLEVSLYLNGSAIAGESVSATNVAGEIAAAGKTVLLNVTAANSNIAIYNTSDSIATLLGASITVMSI